MASLEASLCSLRRLLLSTATTSLGQAFGLLLYRTALLLSLLYVIASLETIPVPFSPLLSPSALFTLLGAVVVVVVIFNG